MNLPSRAWTFPALALLLACAREEPRRVENANLGVAAFFPGEPRLNRHIEPSPYGPIEWFDLAMNPAGRLDESFSISVGNLPKGRQGGSTEAEVLATCEKWIAGRIQGFQRTELAAARGPGFRWRGRGPMGAWADGIVVVRRGRLHMAQAVVRKEGDPRTAAFLDGFEVAR